MLYGPPLRPQCGTSYTDYDERLMSGTDRETARRHVYGRIEEVLTSWRDTRGMPCDSD